MRAAVPASESKRLAKLRELRVLDTLPEESFDAIVTALSELLKIPLALIVFVDEDRQWFKAKRGTNIEETSREVSFCAHTILGEEVLISSNTMEDPRFSDNPHVTGGPKYRFYAGSPIFYQGQPMGSLCCLDFAPRNLTESEKRGLAAMARQVSALLEARSIASKLIESEARFASLIDAMHDGMLVWNEHCTIVLANDRAAEIYECSQSSLIGCGPAATTWDLLYEGGKRLPPEEHPAIVTLREGVPQVGQIMDLVSLKSGATKSVLFNCTPLFKPGAKIAHGVVTTLTDVTERKRIRVALATMNEELETRAAERASELTQFFSVSMDMLCISDVAGTFTRVNPAFTACLGWLENELVGRSQLDFVHPDDLDRVRKELAEYTSQSSPRQFENRYLHKDSSYRTLWWKSAPLDNGLIYSAARDITEQREMEQALRVAVEEARQANLAKSEFLSRMSHELRTPMNAVLGYAQLLDLKYKDPNIRSATESILRGGNHLLQLINQVLDLSRIETGKLGISMEPVDYADILSHAIALLKPTALEAGVELIIEGSTDEATIVEADRQRLLQILLNLISNGIKYNRAGGKMRFRWRELSSETWNLEFEDTGIGIPEKGRDLLFQPFQRFSDPGIEGSGLGLSISQRFANLMGGDLSLDRSDDGGSLFVLTLRKGIADERGRVSLVSADSTNLPTIRGTVLYIEDNLSNIRLIESVLADWENVSLLPAMQGFVGLELARTQIPDLILLDIHLPDLMGDQVLERLKSDPITRDIPVVVLSADATRRQIATSMAGGALEYLTKPLDLKQLYKVLHEVLPPLIPPE
jgi:PAS domain S-box-containing protein